MLVNDMCRYECVGMDAAGLPAEERKSMWNPYWAGIFKHNEWGKYPPEELIRFIAPLSGVRLRSWRSVAGLARMCGIWSERGFRSPGLRAAA